MDAKQLFFERYEGFQEYPEHLLKGLSDDQVRQPAHPAVNPIAWILWHIARCEDVGVNRLLCDGRQVLDEDRWATLSGVTGPGVGTGMSRADVLELSARIDLGELEAYRLAVVARTRATVPSLPLAELDAVLPPERLQRVFVAEGAGGGAGAAIVEAYTGHTMGWLLGHLVLTHHYYHIGQAFAYRTMHGAVNPW